MSVGYTRRAEADLLAIGEYTLRTWGEAQADRYLSDIKARCEQIGAAPDKGRACDQVRPGLRCIGVGKHVIFFVRHAQGALVIRILHERMLPERHVFEDTAPP